MENINLKINGLDVSAPAGSTILEAAHLAGIKIPTLCFLKEINEIGACRMCVVEVKGARNLVAACVHPINEGMEVYTNTPQLIKARKKTLQLLLSNHDKKCLSCVRSGNCELQQLCREYGVDDENFFEGKVNHYELDTSAAIWFVITTSVSYAAAVSRSVKRYRESALSAPTTADSAQ